MGNGRKTNVCRDAWSENESMGELIQGINWGRMETKLESVTRNGEWDFPENVVSLFARVGYDLQLP